jgi:myotubularin-related protein 1/2
VAKYISGWDAYDFWKEIRRMGVEPFIGKHGEHKEGKAYQLLDNSPFELSHTYPAKLIVPGNLTETEISRCADFRTKERLPILTYFYQYKPNAFSSLFRCSQTKGGLLAIRCPEDEKMVQGIDWATRVVNHGPPQDPKYRLNCKIYDARGYYAAWGNKLAGKGF